MGGMFVKEEPSPAVQEYVDREIRENKVMVFSKSTCPYCKMAKKALTGKTLVCVSDSRFVQP